MCLIHDFKTGEIQKRKYDINSTKDVKELV